MAYLLSLNTNFYIVILRCVTCIQQPTVIFRTELHTPRNVLVSVVLIDDMRILNCNNNGIPSRMMYKVLFASLS